MDEYWSHIGIDSITVANDTAFETPVSTAADASYALDVQNRFVAVDDEFVELTGYSRATLLDAHLSLVLPDRTANSVAELLRAFGTAESNTLDTNSDTPDATNAGPFDGVPATAVSLELPLRDAAGEAIRCRHRFRAGRDSDRLSVVVRPEPESMTETHASGVAESEWDSPIARDGDESTESSGGSSSTDRSPADELLDRVTDGVYALDADLQYTFVNEPVRKLLASDGSDETAADAEGIASPFEPVHERALEIGSPLTVETSHPPTGSWLEARLFPSGTGLTVVVRDVTDRRERERALEQENRKLHAVIEDADDAVLVGDDERIDAANSAATELFGLNRSELRGRSLAEFVSDDHDMGEAWAEFMETGHYREAFSVVRPDGTERVVECNAVADVLPGKHLSILRDVTAQRERERQLERQRERLTALRGVSDVVREINDVIVTGSTQERLEAVTCEALADSQSYEFAFVAGVDSKAGDVVQRAEAGVEGYVESVPLSTDPDDPAGRGPLGRAVRSQRMQVSNDVFEDPDFEPWHEDARERGYVSAAAIPITHNGALYGILGVASARRNAFVDEERETVGQLGEILGHAIAARERKRALMGDELIELEYEIRNVTELFDGPAMTDRRVSFDRVVQVDDEQFLEYGTTTTETFPVFEELAEGVPHWEEITVLDESAGEVTFELAISSPPMFSVVADHGGYVESAAIDDGEYTMTVHLPKRADVRAVTSAIKDVYPTATNVARRQVKPSSESIAQVQDRLHDALTERQRTALETAYYAGFFEWPRNSSGEEIAETLDVSPATFHEHLRTAQEKLVGTVFDEPDTTRGGQADAD